MYLVWETDSWYRTEVCDVLSGMVDEADQKTFILTSRPDQPRLLSPVSPPSSYPGFFLSVSHQPFLRFFCRIPSLSLSSSSFPSSLPSSPSQLFSQFLSQFLPHSLSSAESLLTVSHISFPSPSQLFSQFLSPFLSPFLPHSLFTIVPIIIAQFGSFRKFTARRAEI